MIVEIRLVVTTDDAVDTIVTVGRHELIVQVPDVEGNVLAASAKVTELTDFAREAALNQLREIGVVQGEQQAQAEEPRSRPFGRRP